jgi:hypothetical protein
MFMFRAEDEVVADMISYCCEECRLRRDACDGANAMVCDVSSAMAAEAWATRRLLIFAVV